MERIKMLLFRLWRRSGILGICVGYFKVIVGDAPWLGIVAWEADLGQ